MNDQGKSRKWKSRLNHSVASTNFSVWLLHNQPTERASQETEICLRSQSEKLYHMGMGGGISRNTLCNANTLRDWRIYADFAQVLIKIARPLYAEEDLGFEFDNTIYALDASTIDICLSGLPWALFRSTKSAIKLHTLLDSELTYFRSQPGVSGVMSPLLNVTVKDPID